MKRLMIATALTTTIATSAFAVTDAQVQEIQTFAPSINIETMSESQLETAYGIVTSGSSRSDKLAQLESLALSETPDDAAMISEAEMNRLAEYAPDADLSMITQAQAEAAIAVTYGGSSEGDKMQRVQAILNDYNVVDTMAADISEGRLNIIRTYAPDVDPAQLSEEDVQLIMTFIHSGMSRSDKLNQIESVING